MKTNQRRQAVTRFLDAWLAVRQLVHAANFNRFQSAGLSATQFMILNVIPSTEGGTTLTELGQRMNLGLATLARSVDSLEARALIVRTRREGDRRHVMLTLTPEGKRLQNAASGDFHEHMARLFNRLSGGERDGLVAGLEALARAGSTAPASAATPGDGPPARRSSPRSRTPKS